MKRLYTLMAICLLAMVLTPDTIRAQYYKEIHKEDTQLHTGVDVTGRINERWSVNWGEELYFGNNISRYDKLYSRLMVNYYLTPNLRIAPMVMLIMNRPADTRTMIYDLNLFYSYKWDRLSLTLREGLRVSDKFFPTRESPFLTVKTNPEVMWRSQVSTTYKLTPYLEPFANIETFVLLNPATHTFSSGGSHTVGYYLPRVRSNVGVKVRLNSYNAITLYWRCDLTKSKYLSYELMDSPYGIITNSQTANMVGLFYHLTF